MGEYNMTVKELKKKLEDYDDDAEVLIHPPGSTCSYRIDYVTLNDLPSFYKYGVEDIVIIS